MKTVAIVIARMGSSRLPGKVLSDLGGKAVLRWVTDAAWNAPGVDEVWVATTKQPADDAIWDWCEENGGDCWRGSEDDVLARFTETAQVAEADIVVRLTGDCPFHDPRVIGEIVALRAALGVDYASNVDPPTWPDGLDCEVFTYNALQHAHAYARRPSDRGCVTQFVLRNKALFSSANLTCPLPGMHKERWVLDTVNDQRFCQAVAHGAEDFSYLGILDFLNKNPDVRKINKHHPRNERFLADLVAEEPVERKFTLSKAMLPRVESIIPLAAQTFSKSTLQYPEQAPLFASHGDGGLIYDVDGNDYVDLVMGLLPVVLGHRDPDVDRAVRAQMDKGVSLSLSTPLEERLANVLNELIPCADMVRFGKNGTDVTQAAIRLARHVTGRSCILSSGYHGWADAFIAHDPVRNAGVTDKVKDQTTMLEYGEVVKAVKLIMTGVYACVIVEPETDPVFLTGLRKACTQSSTLLIFDEIITGFRFALGGAQSVFNITPDLATFGKSMANGYAISALVGKRRFMQHMTEICFSGTFFGDGIGLAAALATIDKMHQHYVLARIHAMGTSLMNAVKEIDKDEQFIEISGDYLQRLRFRDQEVKTLFMQEMIKHGVLIISSHNLCYAHTTADCERILKAYRATFEVLRQNDTKGLIVGHTIPETASVRHAG